MKNYLYLLSFITLLTLPTFLLFISNSKLEKYLSDYNKIKFCACCRPQKENFKRQ